MFPNVSQNKNGREIFRKTKGGRAKNPRLDDSKRKKKGFTNSKNIVELDIARNKHINLVVDTGADISMIKKNRLKKLRQYL